MQDIFIQYCNSEIQEAMEEHICDFVIEVIYWVLFGFQIDIFYLIHYFYILGVDDNLIVSDDFDLTAISDKLRLVSINNETPQLDSATLKSDEELARLLQQEEEALMF